MHLGDILSAQRVLQNVKSVSKKQALDLVSSIIAECANLDTKNVLDALITREKLGSTGIGEGVAIPHARLEGLDEALACLLVLDKAVDFDAPDDKPVDIIFGLLVPENATSSHLEILAELAEKMSHDQVRDSIRQAQNHDTLYALVTSRD